MNATGTQKLGIPELLAMGIGGMIGGGIFSVLGMTVEIAGHAAPLAFAIGSLVALAAGYSYVKLALGFHSDGASFTYLERAFPKHPNVAGITGWAVVVGYVGTLALYAYTFGAYGAHLLGSAESPAVRMVLSAGVLLFFMVVNLRGVHASGVTEDLIVATKVILLGLFAIAGAFYIKQDHLVPVFEKGVSSVFVAGAMIFVAFEGFQLITNAVLETENPTRNIPRGIYGSIVVTSLIYIGVALVAVGNLTVEELTAAEEYALSVAAKPALGNAGQILVDIAALLATSSAINATAFGASRMMAEMATGKRMPAAFSFRSRADVPWVAVVALTGLAMVFTILGGLETIATFSSATFLLVSLGVSVANLRLRSRTNSKLSLILLGIGLMLTTLSLLITHLAANEPTTLFWLIGFFAAIAIVEIIFCQRECPTPTEKDDVDAT
ncbi:Inner membrane transport protein YbaT [Bremerella volcania]|uniref:Inner membrane transport protein YbaT n=1 Tax=Bremerella volcania TaxID=2527984 RepID=A0A518C5W3_9BACT|nr:APC family permease [Bremerella volcania]QDU74607.1 Inner membrane transport protein YbaT [Bremerella volcania]